MSDASQNSRGPLEQLKKSVRGYSGYENPDERAQTDQAFRAQLIGSISKLTSSLDNSASAENEDDQPRLDSLNSNAKKSLITIGQSLENPTYSGSPFFSKMDADATHLDRIYELERVMVDSLENLSSEIAAMSQRKLAREDFEEHYLHIHDYIDNINQSLFEREALILGDIY